MITAEIESQCTHLDDGKEYIGTVIGHLVTIRTLGERFLLVIGQDGQNSASIWADRIVKGDK